MSTNASSPPEGQRPTFEQALAEAREIATQFDKGTLTLDQQLGKLERGAELLRICHRAIEAFDGRIKELIVVKDGQPTLRLFEPEDAA